MQLLLLLLRPILSGNVRTAAAEAKSAAFLSVVDVRIFPGMSDCCCCCCCSPAIRPAPDPPPPGFAEPRTGVHFGTGVQYIGDSDSINMRPMPELARCRSSPDAGARPMPELARSIVPTFHHSDILSKL